MLKFRAVIGNHVQNTINGAGIFTDTNPNYMYPLNETLMLASKNMIPGSDSFMTQHMTSTLMSLAQTSDREVVRCPFSGVLKILIQQSCCQIPK